MNVVWVVGSTLVKMLYGILVYKYITITYGVENLGTAGQLLSAMSILLILSNTGINRGIIQSYSRNKDNPENISALNNASTIIYFASSLTLFVLVILLAKPLSLFIFGTTEFTYLVSVLSLMPLFMGINNNISSIGIAFGKSKAISQSTLLAFILGLIAVFFIGKYSFHNLLIAIAIQSIFLSLFLFLLNYKLFFAHIRLSLKNIAWSEVRKFLGFSFVIILPVIMIQLTLIVNRIHIGEGFGKLQLGLWEATIKLQEGYIQIVAVLLIYFMLPQASESIEKAYSVAKKFIIKAFLVLVFAVIFTALLGELILKLVYNEETTIMANNLLILTISDSIRSIFIVNQYLLLAIVKIRTFLMLEVFTYLSSVLYVWYVSNNSAFDNLFYGYLIQSVILSTLSLYVVNKSKKNV